MTTSQKIINLLNRKPLTVSRLAEALNISRNSAHLQVVKLEAAGAVEKLKLSHERPAGAGKPAFYYRTVGGHEDAFSLAAKPILSELVQTLCAELPEQNRILLLEHTGRSLAMAAGLRPTTDLNADVSKAVDAVNTLGAMAELSCRNQKPYVSCHSCPVATLVHTDPMICRLVAAFFSAATDRRVLIQCRRKETVVCGFLFSED